MKARVGEYECIVSNITGSDTRLYKLLFPMWRERDFIELLPSYFEIDVTEHAWTPRRSHSRYA